MSPTLNHRTKLPLFQRLPKGSIAIVEERCAFPYVNAWSVGVDDYQQVECAAC